MTSPSTATLAEVKYGAFLLRTEDGRSSLICYDALAQLERYPSGEEKHDGATARLVDGRSVPFVADPHLLTGLFNTLLNRRSA